MGLRMLLPAETSSSSHTVSLRNNVFSISPPSALRCSVSDELRAGLDAKVILHDALTLDVALNPDFSQLESDEPQVALNQRYEVFFPERRPFFLENSGYFDTPETLFFSRRIVDPQFGARLTGKLGGWALGLLGMDDRAANTLDHKQLTQELSALPGAHAAPLAVVAPRSA